MSTSPNRPSAETIQNLRELAARGLDEQQLRAEIVRVAARQRATEADVRSWLAALESPVDGPADHPERIGAFRILEVLGEGGMGTVYRAEQDAPVKRQVALKLIKAGMDTKAVVARFEHERQALAVMEHDGIAKVYDCGTSERGQPFFVMELVRGVPLTDYCELHRLSLQERIGLLQQVCAAVQHAHQKGVVHRDLKPANVLVADDNGRRQVKVIDFGLAKAIGTELAASAPVTLAGHFVGTPEYVAPEQADPGNADIDTRADVYSLGVMLYELLVDELPFSGDELRKAGVLEMQRLLRDVDPPKPSARLSAAGARSGAIAGARQVSSSALRRVLRNDLDWVVLRALDKNRNRRYESPGALAADLQRFLDDQPLLAGPPSAVYRLRKFVRRHGRLVGIGAVIVASVGISLAALWYSSNEVAANEVAICRDLRRIYRQKATESSGLKSIAGSRGLRRANLEWDIASLLELVRAPAMELLKDPLAQAHLALGELEHELSRTADAMAHYRAALDLASSARVPPFRPDEVQLLRSRANLLVADLQRETGEPAEQSYRAAEQDARQAAANPGVADETQEALAAACEHHGNFLAAQHGMESGRPLIDEALRILVDLAAQHPGVEHWDELLQEAYYKQARLVHMGGNAAAAEGRYLDAVAITQRLHLAHPLDSEIGQQHARNLRAHGDCLLDLGRNDEALQRIEAARDLRLAVLEIEPLQADAWLGLVKDRLWLAQVRLERNETDDAGREIRDAEQRLTKLIARDPQAIDAVRMLPQVLSTLASVVWKADGAAAAARELTRAGEAADAAVAISPTAYDTRTAAETWQMVAALRASLGDTDGAATANAAARGAFESAIAMTTGATQRTLRSGLLELDLNTALAANDAAAVLRISDELLPLQRAACDESSRGSEVFTLAATLLYRARAALQLDQREPAFAAFDEIRARSARFRDGGTTPQMRRVFADARFEYQEALRTAGDPRAAEVAQDALAWFRALATAGQDVAARIAALEQLVGR